MLNRTGWAVLAIGLALAGCGPGDSSARRAGQKDPPAETGTRAVLIDGQRIDAGPLRYRGMRAGEVESLGPGDIRKPSNGATFVAFEYDVTNTGREQVSFDQVSHPVLKDSDDTLYRADERLTEVFHRSYGQPPPSLIGPGMTVTVTAIYEVPSGYLRKFWLWSADGRRYAEMPHEMTRQEAEAKAAQADRRRAAGDPENDFRAPRPGDPPEACGSAGCPND